MDGAASSSAVKGAEAARLAATFAEGTAEEREAAYAAIEAAVRAAPSDASKGGGGYKRSQAVALAVACVRPLIADVLCANGCWRSSEGHQSASCELLTRLHAIE